MNKLTLPLILTVILFGMSPDPAPAQDNNNLYFELLGNGLFYSFNYERGFTDNIYGRLGFSYGNITGESAGGTREVEGSLVTVPIMVNYLSGENNSRLEVGGGFTIVSMDLDNPSSSLMIFDEESVVLLTGTIGYRYQRPNGGLMFKIAFTPVTNFSAFAPFGGLGLGYTF